VAMVLKSNTKRANNMRLEKSNQKASLTPNKTTLWR
jgi:hypothetical protein